MIHMENVSQLMEQNCLQSAPVHEVLGHLSVPNPYLDVMHEIF